MLGPVISCNYVGRFTNWNIQPCSLVDGILRASRISGDLVGVGNTQLAQVRDSQVKIYRHLLDWWVRIQIASAINIPSWHVPSHESIETGDIDLVP